MVCASCSGRYSIEDTNERSVNDVNLDVFERPDRRMASSLDGPVDNQMFYLITQEFITTTLAVSLFDYAKNVARLQDDRKLLHLR